MPVYEYECKHCNRITEAIQKFSESPLSKCPHCNGRLKKLMSLNSFHLKGSGWYVTDYAGKKPGSQTEKCDTEKSAKDGNGGKAEKSDSGNKNSSEN